MTITRSTQWVGCHQGKGDLASVASASALNLTSAGCLSVWLYVFSEDIVNYPILICKGDINSAYQMQIDNDDAPTKKVLFRIKIGGSTYSAKDPSAVPRDTWVHYAGRWNGTNVQLVKNGTQVATTAASGSCATNSGPLRFGDGESAGSNRYFGLMADARLWNIYRNDAAIAGDISTPLVGNETGLVGNWQFDEGLGLVVNDKTSNAFDLAAVNSHQWSSSAGLPY